MKTRFSFLFALLAAAICMFALPTVASATFSGADGRIYFVCYANGKGYSGADICSVEPDGRGLLNLTNTPNDHEGMPDVSADGRLVTFIRRVGDSGSSFAWVMNADGSGQRQISTVPADGPVFRPDGKIVFRAKVAGNSYQLQVTSPSGGTPSTFYTDGITGSTQGVAFSKTGAFSFLRAVATGENDGMGWIYADQIHVVTGGVAKQITPATAGLNSIFSTSWAPDGGTILFTRPTVGTTVDIFSVGSGGGTQTQLTHLPATTSASRPVVSPSGTRMAWSQTNPGDSSLERRRLIVAARDASAPVEIALPGVPYADSPVWAVKPSGGSADIKLKAAKKLKLGSKVSLKKKLSLKVSCLGTTSCVVSFATTLKVPGKTRKAKAKSFKIKLKTQKIAAKKSKTIKIAVPKKAQKALRAAFKAKKKATLTIKATGRTPAKALIRKRTAKVSVTR